MCCAKTAALFAGAALRTVFFQCRAKVEPRALQSWDQTEQDSSYKSQRQRVTEHTKVGRNINARVENIWGKWEVNKLRDGCETTRTRTAIPALLRTWKAGDSLSTIAAPDATGFAADG